MKYLISILFLAGCSHGGGGKSSSTTVDSPPPPPPVYTDYVATDVPGTMSGSNKPTVVRGGDDGSWHVEFTWIRSNVTYHPVFDYPASCVYTEGAATWTMNKWSVDGADVVDCNITGTPELGMVLHWQLTPIVPTAGG